MTNGNFKPHKKTTNILDDKPLAPVISKKRFNMNLNDTEQDHQKEVYDTFELPEIVSVTEDAWNALTKRRPSMYSQYDEMTVGQVIMGLDRQRAATICSRLKKIGMGVQLKQIEPQVFAIRRIK